MAGVRVADQQGVAGQVQRLQQQGHRTAVGGDEQVDRAGALGVGRAQEDLSLRLVAFQHEVPRVTGDLADAAVFDGDAGDLSPRHLGHHRLAVLGVQHLQGHGGGWREA